MESDLKLSLPLCITVLDYFLFFHREGPTYKIQLFYTLTVSLLEGGDCVATFAFSVQFPLISSRKGVKLKLSSLEIMLFQGDFVQKYKDC